MNTLSTNLPRSPDSVGAARRLVNGHTPSLDSQQRQDAALMVSELVTNAVRHTRSGRLAMVLYLEADGGWLRIEVHDADPHEPRQRQPGALDESGFGLLLIEALAGKWGVEQTMTGKAVWAELDARQVA